MDTLDTVTYVSLVTKIWFLWMTALWLQARKDASSPSLSRAPPAAHCPWHLDPSFTRLPKPHSPDGNNRNVGEGRGREREKKKRERKEKETTKTALWQAG